MACLFLFLLLCLENLRLGLVWPYVLCWLCDRQMSECSTIYPLTVTLLLVWTKTITLSRLAFRHNVLANRSYYWCRDGLFVCLFVSVCMGRAEQTRFLHGKMPDKMTYFSRGPLKGYTPTICHSNLKQSLIRWYFLAITSHKKHWPISHRKVDWELPDHTWQNNKFSLLRTKPVVVGVVSENFVKEGLA